MEVPAPRKKAVNILDLPNETIDQILCELKWDQPTPPHPDKLHFYEDLVRNAADIRSARATCRRLAAAALPLAPLPVVTVSICDPASVDRLEEVSRRGGATAQQVKAVHVRLDFYERELALDDDGDAGKLMGYFVRNRQELFRAEDDEEEEDDVAGCETRGGGGGVEGGKRRKLPHDLSREEWDRIYDAWKIVFRDQERVRATSGGEDRESQYLKRTQELNSDSAALRVLLEEQAEYRRRYEAQQSMLQSGAFERRVAGAMARLPMANRLVLEDGPERGRRRVGHWLAKPLSWTTAFKIGLGDPPINTAFNLPHAMHSAGVELAGLRIRRLRIPDRSPLWSVAWPQGPHGELLGGMPEADHESFERLRDACANLRVLEYDPDYEEECWPTASPTHLAWPRLYDRRTGSPHAWSTKTDFAQILAPMMLASSRSLVAVSVDLQVVRFGNPVRFVLPDPEGEGGETHWPHIEAVHARDCQVECGALERFLTAHVAEEGGRLAQLHLDGVDLVEAEAGAWAGVLDLLREHSGRMWRNGNRGRLRILGPPGPGTTPARIVSSSADVPIRLRRPRRLDYWYSGLVMEEDICRIEACFNKESEHPDRAGLSDVDLYVNGFDLAQQNPLVELGLSSMV